MQALPDTSGPMGFAEPTTALPLLTLNSTDVDEFDYSTFLQDQQDIDYLAEESSGSTAEPQLTPSSGAVSSDSSLQVLAPRQGHLAPSAALAAQPRNHAGRDSKTNPGAQGHAKQRLERRGHTKSRRGCFNCKRRRIKCQETRPACGHCVKQGLKCEYPSLPTIVHQPQHQVPLFSLQDMRFFQHFLLNCYPHHPIGSEDLWTHEIPCLSQKYEYLMHAILGYSASELMATTDPSLAEAAMSHRLKAIKAIKRALASSTPSPSPCPNSSSFPSSSSSPNPSNHPTTTTTSSSSPHPSSSSPPPAPPQPPPGSRNDPLFEEGNALMATCFALTYQSVLLDDGLAEYMTFIRGIMIVAIQMYCKGATLLFGPLLGDSQKEVLRPHMEELGLIDAGWTARAVRGVEGLRGLVVGVEGREVEERYWELISEMAKMLSVSSWKAYVALTEHYAWWMMLPHDKFQRLVDPGNQVVILLGAHWIALEQIMAVICDAERKGATKTPKQSSGISPGNIGWLKYLNAQVDQEHRAYNQWPMWVEAQLNKDRGFFGKTH